MLGLFILRVSVGLFSVAPFHLWSTSKGVLVCVKQKTILEISPLCVLVYNVTKKYLKQLPYPVVFFFYLYFSVEFTFTYVVTYVSNGGGVSIVFNDIA